MVLLRMSIRLSREQTEKQLRICRGFSVKIDPNATFNDPTIQGVDLTLKISRGAVVQVYTISILIAICTWLFSSRTTVRSYAGHSVGLVTLTLLASTVSVVILGRKMAKEVLAVPVGTLFAFTSLRGTLPGAPVGFGKPLLGISGLQKLTNPMCAGLLSGAIIDFMAVLPCLAILTFCVRISFHCQLKENDTSVTGCFHAGRFRRRPRPQLTTPPSLEWSCGSSQGSVENKVLIVPMICWIKTQPCRFAL